jgi:hypothetical protein
VCLVTLEQLDVRPQVTLGERGSAAAACGAGTRPRAVDSLLDTPLQQLLGTACCIPALTHSRVARSHECQAAELCAAARGAPSCDG